MSNNIHYSHSLERLRQIVDELRIKCPWDRKQDFNSLKSQTVEEVYELIDAINKADWDNVSEELGDLLLHIVFYCKLGSEQQSFTLDDVIIKICNKLVARHPHVYGHTAVKDETEVISNWESIKKKEGKKSILSGIPDALPALNRAMAIQKKASHVGFDWNNPIDMLNKVKEELAELEVEILKGDKDNIQKELGDTLFSLININRYYKFNEDDTLNLCNNKFIKRFKYIEDKLNAQSLDISTTPLEILEELWIEAKAYDV